MTIEKGNETEQRNQKCVCKIEQVFLKKKTSTQRKEVNWTK